MKHQFLYLICFVAFLFGCKDELSVEEQMDPKTTACYIAVSGVDTGWLRIDTVQTIGLFEMNYAKKKQRYLGEFRGVTSGDTIKGHWDFKANNAEKWHRNPIALLKNNGKLTMGVGKIVMIWGSPHFDEKTPINYNRGKFVFDLATCRN